MIRKTLGSQNHPLIICLKNVKWMGLKEIFSELLENIEKRFRTSCWYLKQNVKN